jgi:phosphatidylserine decarboxylase
VKSFHLNHHVPLAREGLPFILLAGAITLMFGFLGLPVLLVLSGILTIFVISFFRDPPRRAPEVARSVLSPADGKILRIEELPASSTPLGTPTLRLSIFMSVFDVHVNRMPFDGVVRAVSYHPGTFFSANLDKASELNEHNEVVVDTSDSSRFAVVQIAGLIARRIVCRLRPGDIAVRGGRFGMIRFGSRVDVYLPGDSHITAKERQRVKAGKTVIGYLT